MTDAEIIGIIQEALADVAPKRAGEFDDIAVETTIVKLGSRPNQSELPASASAKSSLAKGSL